MNDVAIGQFPQTVVDNDENGRTHRHDYHFKRVDSYDPYNRYVSISGQEISHFFSTNITVTLINSSSQIHWTYLRCELSTERAYAS